MAVASPIATTDDRPEATPQRLHGVDLARGLAVIGMLFVDNRGNGLISDQFKHTAWNGVRVADVVFPLFLLVVGVSMSFSRRAQRPRAVAGRVVKLALLGWLIVTAKYGWGAVVPGVLGHIAGAYLLCWLLLRLPRRAQIPVAAGVLAGLSLLYLVVPVPDVGRAVVSPEQSWAVWLDQALGLGFGAEMPHAYLPSAITVFLGVLAGRVLQDRPGASALPALVRPGVVLVAAGAALGLVLPLNKQMWTPSYVLLTGGLGLLLLAATHWLIDVRGLRRPFRPAEVLGVNAIVAFAFSELVFRALLAHRVQPVAVAWLGDALTPTAAAYLYPALAVLVIWAVCAALDRRGVVVRI